MELCLSDDVRSYTRHIVDSCGLYSASIFLCDRTAAAPQLSYLYNYRIAEEVKDQYERHAIFHGDPFTDPFVQEQADRMDDDGLLLGSDSRVQSRSSSVSYWRFMNEHAIDVVGASTRRLMPHLYVTVGFQRRLGGKCRDAIAVKRLDAQVRRLQDMTGGQMLQHLLRRANGLTDFRASYFNNVDSGSMNPFTRLSAREIEVANLVCQGRQNKEIAYLIGLSEHTVENHLRRIYAKLSIHNRSALVAAMTAAASFGER